MRIALLAGSFDPLTIGHAEIVERADGLFDEIIVAIGVNSQKKYMFSLEQRLALLEAAFEHLPHVRVASYEGTTLDFAESQGARFLLRGLRNAQDFEYENTLAQLNRRLTKGQLETVFLNSSAELSWVSSTIAREVIRYNKDLEGLLPEKLIPLIKKFRGQN